MVVRRARFKVGFGTSSTPETASGSGVWEDVITERFYYGEVIRNNRQIRDDTTIIGDSTLNNALSILAADQYAKNLFYAIKYAEWTGILWTVTNVELQYPRLILTLGDRYNGPTA